MIETLCGTAPEWLSEAFLQRGIKLTCVGPCPALPQPVSGHIDLMTVQIGESHFAAPESEPLLSPYWNGSKITVAEHLQAEYPGDVLLSALQVEGYLLCRISSISKDVKRKALQENLELLDVNQGYVKCSVCKCSEHAVITDDPSIASALRSQTAVRVLEISKGDIRLPGYSYGFIGGASGKVGNTLYFFGNLDGVRDAGKIRDFLAENEIPYVCLSHSQPLTDIGGIIPV